MLSASANLRCITPSVNKPFLSPYIKARNILRRARDTPDGMLQLVTRLIESNKTLSYTWENAGAFACQNPDHSMPCCWLSGVCCFREVPISLHLVRRFVLPAMRSLCAPQSPQDRRHDGRSWKNTKPTATLPIKHAHHSKLWSTWVFDTGTSADLLAPSYHPPLVCPVRDVWPGQSTAQRETSEERVVSILFHRLA